MKGAGYYSRATIGAKHVMDNAARLVLDAVDRMQLKDDGSVFRATDMGAADGGTSLALWGQVLSKVRQQAPSRAIEMIYTDLPRNDFSQLFQIVHGLTDTQSYLSDVSGVHVMASATSFHEAIVPAGTPPRPAIPARGASPPCVREVCRSVVSSASARPPTKRALSSPSSTTNSP